MVFIALHADEIWPEILKPRKIYGEAKFMGSVGPKEPKIFEKFLKNALKSIENHVFIRKL